MKEKGWGGTWGKKKSAEEVGVKKSQQAKENASREAAGGKARPAHSTSKKKKVVGPETHRVGQASVSPVAQDKDRA